MLEKQLILHTAQFKQTFETERSINHTKSIKDKVILVNSISSITLRTHRNLFEPKIVLQKQFSEKNNIQYCF